MSTSGVGAKAKAGSGAGAPPPLDPSLTNQIGNALQSKGIATTTRVTASAPMPAKIPTLQQLQKMVQEITGPDAQMVKDLSPWPKGLTPHSVPFKYIPDGCYARAHMMIDRMQQDGYASSKIFAIGNLAAKNEVFPQGVSWWYHVAPLVEVDDNGTKRLVVVDPALNPGNPIMSPEDWAAAIDPSKGQVKLEITDPTQYYPMNGGAANPQAFNANIKPADGTCVKYTQTLNGMGVKAGAAPAPGAEPAPATHDLVENANVLDVTPNNEVHLHNSARRIKATPDQAKTLLAAKKAGKAVHVHVSHAADASGFHTIGKITVAN
ncbi:MAG TPA: protein-glutamine glutaminase family protein [Myxococcaceae bacterium]|nr:protein-glutamine glutaminase family protein [Myxococcaceae bacterium]